MARKLQKEEKLKEILKFLVILNLFSLPIYAVTYFNISFKPLQDFIALIVSLLLKVVGVEKFREGNFIFLV